MFVTACQGLQSVFYVQALKPGHHGFGAKLDENPFTSVLHCRKPRGIKGDLGSLDIGFIFTLDIRSHRFKGKHSVNTMARKSGLWESGLGSGGSAELVL